MKTTDAIAQAVALLRSRTNLGDVAIYQELAGDGVERLTAARLVEFLPMVYCRLIFLKSGLRFPETYRRALSDGTYSAWFRSPVTNFGTKRRNLQKPR